MNDPTCLLVLELNNRKTRKEEKKESKRKREEKRRINTSSVLPMVVPFSPDPVHSYK